MKNGPLNVWANKTRPRPIIDMEVYRSVGGGRSERGWDRPTLSLLAVQTLVLLSVQTRSTIEVAHLFPFIFFFLKGDGIP